MPINTSKTYLDLKNILHHPGIPITYISNPKAGCSTVKNSLLGGHTGNVHQAIEQLRAHPSDANHPLFTLTRNPYSRALACFKNKIGWGKEVTGNVWLPFARKFGFDAKSQPTFLEFLRALDESTINPAEFDIHYRPQVFNLHAKDIHPSYIGRLENIKDLKAFLSTHSLSLLTRNPRPTGSSGAYQDEICQEAASIIQKIYADDFSYYGYSCDLRAPFQPPPIHQQAWISDRYLLRFRLANLGLTPKDLKRIATQKRKSGDLKTSLRILKNLAVLRPNSRKLQASMWQLEKTIQNQHNQSTNA